MGMAGAIRRYGRMLGGGLLAATAVLAPLGAHVEWVRTATRVYAHAMSEARNADADAADGKAGQKEKAAERKYRAGDRPPRTGETLVRIVPGSGSNSGYWHATARHTVALRPDDPMVEDLRGDSDDLETWLPFSLLIGGATDDCDSQGFGFGPDDDLLEQRRPKSTVYATDLAETDWRGTDYDCLDGHTALTVEPEGEWLGARGIYDRWTVTVESPDRVIVGLDGGTTLSQSPHRARLLLPGGVGRVTVELGGPDTPGAEHLSNIARIGEALQKHLPARREAFWLALAVVAMTVRWVLPFVREWAPSATRRRWTGVAVAGCAVTGAALEYALAGVGLSEPWWAYPGRGAVLAVWWWVLLPFLLAGVAVRVLTGRPPRPYVLLGLLLPSAVLLVPAGVLAVTGHTVRPLVPVAFAVAATAGVAWSLRRGAWGPAGRRWAGTAAGGVWLAVLAAGPGTGLPDNGDGRPFAAWPAVNSLALAALNWGWPAILLAVGAVETRRRWLMPVAGLVLAASLAESAVGHHWAYGWSGQYDGNWTVVGMLPGVAATWPLAGVLILLLCFPLAYLRAHGNAPGEWPPHVRTAVVGLGIAAVGTGFAFYGFVAFDDEWQRSGYYLALAIAALGFSWLLPPGDEARAARLHRTPAFAHNRMVHALLREQALAAGRREFLGSSRVALATGELTARAWNERWLGLGALGSRGTAPQHSAALRLAALGTSGGRTALRNGVAAAVMLGALCLPWMGYTVPSLAAGDAQGIGDLQVWLYTLRWPVYGFVYGYAYSWLRGGSPIGKALCLLAVVLPAELAQLLYSGREPRDFAVSLLLATGNCLAVLLVLGLYWEARLVRAAGLRWGQIRNFRSLSATAVPATTVLVAAATALATAMVGVWITPDNTAPSAPANRPSAESSVTPGP